MPDTECLQVAAAVTSSAVAAISLLARITPSNCTRRRRVRELHAKLLVNNPVFRSADDATSLLHATMISDDVYCDRSFKQLLLGVNNAMSSTWTCLLEDSSEITSERGKAAVRHHFSSIVGNIDDTERIRSLMNVIVSDCVDAFSRCMSISYSSYEHTLHARLEASAACLSSKMRLYIRYLPTVVSDKIHADCSTSTMTYVCHVLTYLGHVPPSWTSYDLPVQDAPAHVLSHIYEAVEAGEPKLFEWNDSQYITALPSKHSCAILWSDEKLAQLFIDVHLATTTPSMFVTVDTFSDKVVRKFVSRHSRLLADATECTPGILISDVLHIKAQVSVFKLSVTPVRVNTYEMGPCRLHMITEL